MRNILPRAARECGAAAALQGARRDLENRILERRNSNRIIRFYARCVPGPLEGDGFEMPAGGPARAPDGSGARPQNSESDSKAGQRCPAPIERRV